MSYEVTATKKRPQSFNDLSGQEFVVATLKNSISTGRIAHAYLFSGPRGVGKTSAARILAKSLNCVEGPKETPCGTCANCLEITKGISLDVIEIDGASNTSVNDVRQIKDEVLFAPANAKYKVYIIDEVHMLSNSAFNALLKTIEEPPPYIVFIFATTEIHKVPATIRSRCQQFSFRLIPLDEIQRRLTAACAEMNIAAEEDALLWIAKESTGSLRDAYTLFDQVVSFSENSVTLEKIRNTLGLVGLDQLNLLAEIFAAGDRKQAFQSVEDIVSSGISIEQFVLDLSEYFRNLLLIKNGIHNPSIIGYAVERFSKQVLLELDAEALEHAVSLLFSVYRGIKFSLNPRYELDLLAARLCGLSSYITPQKILKRIEGMKSLLVEGRAPEAEGQEAAGPGQGEQFSPAMREELFDVLKKREKKITLSSSLEKAVSWQRKDKELVVTFDSMFSANLVRDELPLLRKVIGEILKTPVEIVIKIENAAQAEEKTGAENELDRKVEIVKKVFRGEIVKGE